MSKVLTSSKVASWLVLFLVVKSNVLLDSNGLQAVIKQRGHDKDLLNIILQVVVDEEMKHSSMGNTNRHVLKDEQV